MEKTIIKGSNILINAEFIESAEFKAMLAKEEAFRYLSETDWVEPYLIKHYTGIELLPHDSNKFIIEQKRKEARDIVNV